MIKFDMRVKINDSKLDEFDLMRPFGYHAYDENNRRLVMKTIVQDISEDYRILEAKPFVLLKASKECNQTKFCSLHFVGQNVDIYR